LPAVEAEIVGSTEDGQVQAEVVAEVIRSQWAFYRRHPWLAQVMSFTRPLLTPDAMRFAEWTLNALDGTPDSPRSSLQDGSRSSRDLSRSITCNDFGPKMVAQGNLDDGFVSGPFIRHDRGGSLRKGDRHGGSAGIDPATGTRVGARTGAGIREGVNEPADDL
jgi:hypothetical protein